MKKLTVTYLVTFFVIFGGYLSSAKQARAQSTGVPVFPLMQLEGLHFDTPLPLTPTSHDPITTFNMLSSLKFETLRPIVVSTKKISESISDIVVPSVQAAESTESALISPSDSPESTDSAQILEEVSAEIDTTDEPLSSPTTSPSPTDTVTKKIVTKTTVKKSKVQTTIQAVSTPEISPTPAPTTTPTPAPPEVNASTQAPAGGLNADLLFDMSNNYRKEHGLATFEKDPRACALAQERAPEIGEEIANGHMHSGLRARKLPYWNSENIISMRNEAAAFHWWINDKIHHDQIVGDYKYSCVACYGNSCVQEFSNYIPK